MNQEQAVKIFSENLRKYIKRAKVKQLYLATLIEVTPSAMSQMLKCRLVMSHNQLSAVCKGLKLASEETLEMQTLLSKIRSGTGTILSPFNRFIKTCRREKKLTISKLAQLTKISPIRLRAFENDFNVVFTADDAEKLSSVFELSAEFLLSKNPNAAAENIVYKCNDAENNGIAEASEKNAVYNSVKRVSIIKLDDLKCYSENMELEFFGNMRSSDELIYDIDKQVIGVKTGSDEIDLQIKGSAVFFITDKKPMIYVCRLFLCMDSAKKFHLLHKKEDQDGFFKMSDNGELCEFKEKIRLSFGVVEIKFSPQLLV